MARDSALGKSGSQDGDKEAGIDSNHTIIRTERAPETKVEQMPQESVMTLPASLRRGATQGRGPTQAQKIKREAQQSGGFRMNQIF
jgi:hypothetical protein